MTPLEATYLDAGGQSARATISYTSVTLTFQLTDGSGRAHDHHWLISDLDIQKEGKVFMLQNTWYTVISPESCSSILWRSWDKKEIAAEQLRLTGKDMLNFGLVDDVIPEPPGGAHWDYDQAAENLKNYLIPAINELEKIPAEQRVENRIEKFGKMGFWDEK